MTFNILLDVDKAIRALEKKQEKNLLKEQEEQEHEEGQGGAGTGDGGSLDHPQQHYDQQQHHQHHQHPHQQQQHQHASKQEKMSKHSREEQEGIASPRHGGTPPHSECWGVGRLQDVFVELWE